MTSGRRSCAQASVASPSASSRSCSAAVQLLGGGHRLGQHQPGRRQRPVAARHAAATSVGRPPATAPGTRSRAGRSRGRRRSVSPAPAPTRSPAPRASPRRRGSTSPRSNDQHRRPRQRRQVGGDVPASRAAPRCTPPSPPVANTRSRPPRRARGGGGHGRGAVAAQPVRRAQVAHRQLDQPRRSHTRSSSARSSPTPARRRARRPSRAPRPPARTGLQLVAPTRRLRGAGSPWASIVLSSATTGAPARSAASTSGGRDLVGGGADGTRPRAASWTTWPPRCCPTSTPAPRAPTRPATTPEDVPLRAEGEDRRERGAGEHGRGAVRRDLPGHARAQAGLPGCPDCKKIYESLPPRRRR